MKKNRDHDPREMAPIHAEDPDQVKLVDSPGGCGAVIRYFRDHEELARQYGVIVCGKPSDSIPGKRTWFRCDSCLSEGKT